MKKIFGLILSLVLTCFIGTNAFAEQGYISASASSQIELTPDIANFSVEIVTTSKDSMAKAIAENKQISAKVYENLKKTTDKNRTDSLKTSNYTAVPLYKYNGNKKSLECYQVTNVVKVRTSQIEHIGQIIDKAIADGATAITNVSYDVSNYDAECNKLYAQTSVKAKEQATKIVNAIGSEITGIKSIDSSCSLAGKTNVPRMYSAKLMSVAEDCATGAVNTSTNIEVGTMTLNVRVNICFYVK